MWRPTHRGARGSTAPNTAPRTRARSTRLGLSRHRSRRTLRGQASRGVTVDVPSYRRLTSHLQRRHPRRSTPPPILLLLRESHERSQIPPRLRRARPAAFARQTPGDDDRRFRLDVLTNEGERVVIPRERESTCIGQSRREISRRSKFGRLIPRGEKEKNRQPQRLRTSS